MRKGCYLETELGRLYLEEDDGALVRLTGAPEDNVEQESDPGGVIRLQETDFLRQACEQVREFMSGKRREFSLPIRMEGTPFQKKVWEALRRIPYGETRTYGEIAAEVGSSGGARAVGQACNRNPIMVVVPCHRVVGRGGALVGFGAGLPIKEKLLALEGGAGHGDRGISGNGDSEKR